MSMVTKYASLRNIAAAFVIALGFSAATFASSPAEARVFVNFGVAVPAPGYYYAPAPAWGVWWGGPYAYYYPTYRGSRWWHRHDWCAHHRARCRVW
jgi:hypothetical protein